MIFELSIGPVQSFIMQARRTQDFWAGSFLLSWLAGVACHSVQYQSVGATFTFPKVNDEDIAWIAGGAPPAGDARIARLTNKLCVEVDNTFKPASVVADLRAAWCALSQAVWAADFEPLWPSASREFPTQSDVRAIFQRQVKNMFELNWTLSSRRQLLVRKNFRTHVRPPEPGLKCTVHAGLQELSGQSSIGGATKFWTAVRRRHIRESLKDGERLSAPAYIKRRFSQCFLPEPVRLPSGLTIKGLSLARGVPSTADIASAPWLAQLLRTAEVSALRALADAVPLRERSNPDENLLAAVAAARAQRSGEPAVADVACMDADMFYPSRLVEKGLSDAQKFEICNKINNLRSCTPSRFYTVLRMDVDRLGGNPRAELVARALPKFATAATQEIQAASGYTIFAGGDDLLALLPVEGALDCVARVRQVFVNAIIDAGAGDEFDPVTISAAVVFAHILSPLTHVLAQAQKTLDEHAKQRAGRDAIAMCVAKRGGVAADWWMPWEKALEPLTSAGASSPRRLQIATLAEHISANPTMGEVSSKFLYKIRSHLQNVPLPADAGMPLPDLAVSLLAVEYLASFAGDGNRPTLPQAKDFVAPILAQCQDWRRHVSKGGLVTYAPGSDAYRADAALIARFIANGGEDDQ